MIRINSDRLWDRLMEMAKIGATEKGGVCRVTLTDEDKIGRDLFIQWAKNAGCTVEVDQLGNIFARREGLHPKADPVMIGSHLDSQPTGGKFDGVYGVLAGLEVIETLNDQELKTNRPIEVVSWTNEEGARFAPAMLASGVFSGEFTLEYAYDRTDKKGVRLEDELSRIGYMGSKPIGQRKYHATFEIHIEQGPILEAQNLSVGVVTGVQGIRWYDLVLTGKEAHAGPTPMSYRIDPVRASIEILEGIYAIADRYAPDAKVTVGYMDASPGVKNTVPGTMIVSIDFRHPDASILKMMDDDLKRVLDESSKKNGVTHFLDEIWYSPPVAFADQCIRAVKAAAERLEIPTMEMVSGAGHDAVYVSRVAPTSMIFVPCKDGLSHNELESAKQEDLADGADVLLQAVLEMSK